MGNNKEIRQRMETCRYVLLTLVWISAGVGMINGMRMMSGYYSGIGIIIIIASILGGVFLHFLVNVALAIPFILLNNGDIIESMKNNGINNIKLNNDNAENNFIENNTEEVIQTDVKYTVEEENKIAEIERLEKLFESSNDEDEKVDIAKKLYDLGKTYYWRFIPKDKK